MRIREQRKNNFLEIWLVNRRKILYFIVTSKEKKEFNIWKKKELYTYCSVLGSSIGCGKMDWFDYINISEKL